MANNHLSRWFTKNGSYSNAAEVRNEKHDLIYEDCAGIITALNARLVELGDDVASTLGAPSVVSNQSINNNDASGTRVPSYSSVLCPSENNLEQDIDEPAHASLLHTIKDNGQTNKPLVNIHNLDEQLIIEQKRKILGISDVKPVDHSVVPVDERRTPDMPENLVEFPSNNIFNAQGLENNIARSIAPHHTFSNSNRILDRGKFQNIGDRNVPANVDGINRYLENVNLDDNRCAPSSTHDVAFSRIHSDAQMNLKLQLMNGLGDPFDGSPHLFWCWHHLINMRLLEVNASALDSLFIIKANTTGRPNGLVSDFLVAGVVNPARALEQVWDIFRKRYGSNMLVSKHLKDKILTIQKVEFPLSPQKIHIMEDLLSLCRVILANMDRCPDLKYFDLQDGQRDIWSKMPEKFLNKWRREVNISQNEHDSLPSFEQLVSSVSSFIDEHSNPCFLSTETKISKTLHTEIKRKGNRQSCAYHNMSGHSLSECHAFKNLPVDDRRQFVADEKLCFLCFGSHRAQDCSSNVSCDQCNGAHCSLLHRNASESRKSNALENRPGKFQISDQSTFDVRNNCTQICDSNNKMKTCSKTVLVDVRVAGHSNTVRCLAIIDEQSSDTFCDNKLMNMLRVPSSLQHANTYRISTMANFVTTFNGLNVSGIEVRGANEKEWITLPSTFTHPSIPDSRDEVATPDIVRAHPHIRKFASKFPEIAADHEVLLLIGVNCGAAMRTRCYGSRFPFVHHTALGWAIVGPTCLQANTSQSPYKVLKTKTSSCEHFKADTIFPDQSSLKTLLDDFDTFVERADDDSPGMSKDHEEFNNIMNDGFCIDEAGYMEFPVPFKKNITLPNNRDAVFRRTKNTLNRISRDPTKLEQCVKTMGKYIAADHVVEIPSRNSEYSERICYINVFPVYNQEKNKTRLVMDSSAKHEGISLNDCLLQGPDVTNNLTGVIMRFRNNTVGFSADVECMFHAFRIPLQHQDALRFFWWSDNDPSKKLTAYRSKVHTFGNKCSPSIAAHGLRLSTQHPRAKELDKGSQFILDNFYVDDGLGSEPTVEAAVNTIEQAREILKIFNIRLHKIVATDTNVLQAFPASELAADIDQVDLNKSSLQQALGISWQVSTDQLFLKCHVRPHSFTKRAVLSVNGSLFDPIGIASPVGLFGRVLQRTFMPPKNHANPSEHLGWDDPLPKEYEYDWHQWISHLKESETITIPRCYHPVNFGNIVVSELHVFSDASNLAIGYVIYLRQVNESNRTSVSFVFAKSKVAPRAATTIPRLELCAAMEAARATSIVKSELSLNISDVTFYTDSRVVLGYISNRTKQFSRYVTNRVSTITRNSNPQQWKYVATKENPADIASRPHTPHQLKNTVWFAGPAFLKESVLPKSVFEDKISTNLPEETNDTKVCSLRKVPLNHVAEIVLSASSK